MSHNEVYSKDNIIILQRSEAKEKSFGTSADRINFETALSYYSSDITSLAERK